jgi:hypothetical protein
MMVMLEDDTETLFATLTARSHNPDMYITTAILEEDLAQKMTRVGANSVIAPYDVAGNFLNNATLRPAVNDFFSAILLDQTTTHQITQLYLNDFSPWIGQRLGTQRIPRRTAGRDRLTLGDDHYMYVPRRLYPTGERSPARRCAYHPGHATGVSRERGGKQWAVSTVSRFPCPCAGPEHIYSLDEAEEAIRDAPTLCHHGSGRVAQYANKLNPLIYVIITTAALHGRTLARSFRVIQGNRPEKRCAAPVWIAQAIMVAVKQDRQRADHSSLPRSVSGC